MWSVGVIVGLAVLAGALIWWFFDGPGSTAGLYEEYEPKYRPKVEMVGRLAAKVDAEPEVAADELREGLNPPLAQWQNCGWANAWQARLPARYPVGPSAVEVMDTSRLVHNTRFYLEGKIRYHRWSGPPSHYIRESLEGGLAEVYLVIIRQRSYEPEQEAAVLEGFVFDLRTEGRIGRLAVYVRVPQGIFLPTAPSYSVNRDETPRQASARDWLRDAAKWEFIRKLSDLSGRPCR